MTLDLLDLDERIKAELARRNYKVIRKLGEGNTRTAYEVEYNSGGVIKRRVFKMPKKEIDETSITTLINISKGDLNAREVSALNQITHPGIIEVFDAFKIDGMTATIEEHYDAVSLEDLVKLSGPIRTPERFKQIFNQVLTALKYMHTEGLLHRDIKPSNILIGRHDNFVKIADLQNVGKMDEVKETFFPTRGGTKFTDPYILDALLSGKESRSSLSSEFYALGATMYFALTGEDLFDRILTKDETSKKFINIAGREVSIALLEGGKPVDKIDMKNHDAILKQKLTKVPRQYRSLLWNCLCAHGRKYAGNADTSYRKFDIDFDHAIRTRRAVVWDAVRKHSLIFLGGVTIITGLLAGTKLIQLQERYAERTEPSVFEMLLSDNFNDAGIDFLVAKEQEAIREKLVPEFKYIRENLDKTDKKYDDILSSMEYVNCRSCMSRRLSFSLIRSILMEGGEYAEPDGKPASAVEMHGFKMQRYPTTLLPAAYPRREFSSRGYSLGKYLDTFQNVSMAHRYLRMCIGSNQSLADIFALYFSDTNAEIFKARKKANNVSYFPETKDGKVVPGYGNFLPTIKQRLINRAMALYYITDNIGDVHLDLLDSNNRPIKGLDDK